MEESERARAVAALAGELTSGQIMKRAGFTDREITEMLVSGALTGALGRWWTAYVFVTWALVAAWLRVSAAMFVVVLVAAVVIVWLLARLQAKEMARHHQWVRTIQGWMRRDQMTPAHVELPMNYDAPKAA